MPEPAPSFVTGRRLRVGSLVLVGIVSAVVLALLANYLALSRLRWRRDLTAADRFELSPLTRQVLATITNDVTATVLFTRDTPLFTYVDGLLREYADLQPHLKVRVIDYVAEPNAAALAIAAYKLGKEPGDVIVLDNGTRAPVVIRDSEMSTYDADIGALMAGSTKEIRRTGFKGEVLLTSALARLGDVSPPKACYLQGHAEHRLQDDDQVQGYSSFGRLLGTKNVVVSPLRLEGTNDVPADCELLVIAGPAQPLVATEVTKVQRYLSQGGRLLLLLNAGEPDLHLGLEGVLQNWGVGTPPWYAGDTNNTLHGLDVIATNFASHPITTPLTRAEARVFFQLPRVVGALPPEMLPADPPKTTLLITTGEGGLTKSDLRNGAISFQAGRDRRGVIPLAVASERGGVAGVTAGHGNGRVVVVGDSMAFGNDALNLPGNRDFAELTVAWLLDRTQTLAIGPKPIHEYRLQLTAAQMRALQWTLLGALPGGVLLFGFGVWFRRRS